MQLKKIFFYKVALLMFRVKTSSAPSVFRELFIENRNVHDYFTRQHDKFHVPNAKRNYMQRTISYRGVIVWNHITSKHITYDRSLLSFKFALRKFVFNDDTLLDPVWFIYNCECRHQRYMCSVIAVGNSTTPTPVSWLSWSRDQAFVFAIPWYMDKQVSNLINVIIFLNV